MYSLVYFILVEQLSDVSFIERVFGGVGECVFFELFVIEELLNGVLKVGGVQGGEFIYKGYFLGYLIYIDF